MSFDYRIGNLHTDSCQLMIIVLLFCNTLRYNKNTNIALFNRSFYVLNCTLLCNVFITLVQVVVFSQSLSVTGVDWPGGEWWATGERSPPGTVE